MITNKIKIFEGAEAEIFSISFNNKKAILKKRKPKRYRESILNNKILSQRLKREIKLIEKAKKNNISVPEIYSFDLEKNEIIMEFINLPTAKQITSKNPKKIKFIAKYVAKLHNSHIVHGDLTLQNMFYNEKKDLPIFIDFGLGFVSIKPEDFATDIFVLKETLIAEFNKEIWFDFLETYKNNIDNKETIIKLNKLEKRRKYS